MKHRRVLQEWDKFSKALIHRDASPAQLLSMKMAFYGGVAIFYRIIMDLEPGHEPTDEDVRMLSDIDAEVQEFAAEMKALSKARGRS